MTERESLLANCLNEPADDTARGVYADWLRNQDDAHMQALGRFIWGGVTLSRFRGNEPVTDGMFFDAIADRDKSAPLVLAAQVRPLFGWNWEHVGWDTDVANPDRLTVCEFAYGRSARARSTPSRTKGMSAIYERGMLHTLHAPFERFSEVAAALLAACPLERVEVLDVPGLTFSFGPANSKWYVTGDLLLPARTEWSPSSGVSRRIAEQRIIEPWSMSSREGLVTHIGTAIADTVELIRSRAGGRWPAPQLHEPDPDEPHEAHE